MREAVQRWHEAAAQQFDRLAPQWRSRRAGVEQQADPILARAAFTAGGAILDAGCGTGNWSIILARRGYRVHGTDISPAMIAAAREEALAVGLSGDRISFAHGPIETIAAPDATFDGILCLNVLDFTPVPGSALVEFARVLRPGGRLAISTLGAYSPVRREWWRRFLPGGDPAGVTTVNGIVPWETAALLRDLGWAIIAEAPLFGPSCAGVSNDYDQTDATDPIVLQTLASSWLIVAERGVTGA